MNWFMFQFESQYMLIVAIRLLTACILGGIIGFEREFTNHKPAGLRTHILVSLGACLVMLISEFVMISLKGSADVDPTRIGAQVVSGIGFLGAGAIIRHGVSVKGITTAASIWAVACVGLACGVGFYSAAILVTILVWAILMYLKTIEQRLQRMDNSVKICIEAEFTDADNISLEEDLKKIGLMVNSIDVVKQNGAIVQKVTCRPIHNPMNIKIDEIVKKIMNINGVSRVTL